MAVTTKSGELFMFKAGMIDYPAACLIYFKLCPRVARTISLAFAHDPLIKWLRPNAPLWNVLSPAVCKWQCRRLQQALLDGYVFCTKAIGDNPDLTPQHVHLKQDAVVTEFEKPFSEYEMNRNDVGAAIMLFPPESHLRWTFQRVLLACKLWFMERMDAAPDYGTSEPRLEMLLTAHNASLEKIRSQYSLRDLWYLEVLAVHPHLQGRGIGSKAMTWLLDYLRDNPVVLECTANNNVAFYERFGFKVVEEVELTDNSSSDQDNSTKCWVMFRDRQL